MAESVHVCGVQMIVAHDLEENLPKIIESIAAASDEGADIVHFPEMSLTGYHGDFGDEALQRGIAEVIGAARKHGVACVIGTGWREGGATYIQNRAYDSDGTLLGTHEKMVPTGIDGESGDRKFCVPGTELRTFSWRGITCGMLICNDLWVTPGCGPHVDPRLAYQLGRKGARIIFHSINSGASDGHLPYHESNVALRAEESSLHISTANAALADKPINCSTGLMKPNGQWATRLDRIGEGRYHATVAIE